MAGLCPFPRLPRSTPPRRLCLSASCLLQAQQGPALSPGLTSPASPHTALRAGGGASSSRVAGRGKVGEGEGQARDQKRTQQERGDLKTTWSRRFEKEHLERRGQCLPRQGTGDMERDGVKVDIGRQEDGSTPMSALDGFRPCLPSGKGGMEWQKVREKTVAIPSHPGSFHSLPCS